jgi:hypothetical protein
MNSIPLNGETHTNFENQPTGNSGVLDRALEQVASTPVENAVTATNSAELAQPIVTAVPQAQVAPVIETPVVPQPVVTQAAPYVTANKPLEEPHFAGKFDTNLLPNPNKGASWMIALKMAMRPF